MARRGGTIPTSASVIANHAAALHRIALSLEGAEAELAKHSLAVIQVYDARSIDKTVELAEAYAAGCWKGIREALNHAAHADAIRLAGEKPRKNTAPRVRSVSGSPKRVAEE